MNTYETIMIIDPALDENNLKVTIEKIKTLIAQNGTVKTVEEWGKKMLAYPNQKKNEGYYVLIKFTSQADFIDELERIYNITSEIIKHIVVKMD